MDVVVDGSVVFRGPLKGLARRLPRLQPDRRRLAGIRELLDKKRRDAVEYAQLVAVHESPVEHISAFIVHLRRQIVRQDADKNILLPGIGIEAARQEPRIVIHFIPLARIPAVLRREAGHDDHRIVLVRHVVSLSGKALHPAEGVAVAMPGLDARNGAQGCIVNGFGRRSGGMIRLIRGRILGAHIFHHRDRAIGSIAL